MNYSEKSRPRSGYPVDPGEARKHHAFAPRPGVLLAHRDEEGV